MPQICAGNLGFGLAITLRFLDTRIKVRLDQLKVLLVIFPGAMNPQKSQMRRELFTRYFNSRDIELKQSMVSIDLQDDIELEFSPHYSEHYDYLTEALNVSLERTNRLQVRYSAAPRLGSAADSFSLVFKKYRVYTLFTFNWVDLFDRCSVKSAVWIYTG